ncbi:MAG: beta-lactamase family protein [Caulobacteraceae bacterium]|nr:beta-lactamase family protein [Caulobacteraceae bacterium]
MPVRAAASNRDARLRAVLTAQQAAQRIPGMAFLAVRGGRVVFAEAFGMRDRERALPATLDTRFPIGSATKSFTSMAVALSQDRGLLSLDDRPHRWLPWYRMADPQADRGVTLTDMLSHRTGLRAYADLAAEPGVLTRQEYVRAAVSARPEAPFRSRFQYCNAQYSAAGEVLGQIHGAPWEQVIERLIFAPLGMRTARTSLEQPGADADQAVGYDVAAVEGPRPVPPPRSMVALAPAGAIAASANEMGRWLLMLTAGGRHEGARFVSPQALEALTTPRIDISPSLAYALGWATYRFGDDRVVEHNGGSSGISALVSFMPGRRTGFVFLANRSPNLMTQIGAAAPLIYPLLLEEPPPPAATISTKPPAPPAPAPPDAREAMEGQALEALVARMIAAAGGRSALERHRAMEARGVKVYENQGVRADLSMRAAAPAAFEQTEIWSAAEREIGRLRVFFDGAHGGQETTFGQDGENDPAADKAARRAGALHPLLDFDALYAGATLARGELDGRSVQVLGLTGRDGAREVWSVSEDGLLLRREADGEVFDYADHRPVDGERVPFAIDIRNALGLITVRLDEARFVEAVDPAAFRTSANKSNSR